MTSPPQQPPPGASTPVGQFLRPMRDLAGYALIGATAIWLLVAVIDLIPGGPNEFADRSKASFDHFVNLPNIAFPLGAVLLALLVEPRHPKARLIVLAAVVEYAVIAFFGVLFGVLIGLINTAADNGARAAFEGLLAHVGWLAVFAVAAYAVFMLWQRMFAPPRAPRPGPGVYGQPSQFNPGAYPGQPGYGPQFPPPGPNPGPPPGFDAGPNPGPPPGFDPGPNQHPGQQPGQQPGPHPGQQPGMPPVPGAFGPTTYGQPPQNPSWNQPAMPVQQQGAPVYPVPVSAQPTSAAPAPFSEPTQVVPQHTPAETTPAETTPAEDRTQKFDEPRPGFGPADPDPPRV